jgi:hypothetical protein
MRIRRTTSRMPLRKLADSLFLEAYMRRLPEERAKVIRAAAESV